MGLFAKKRRVSPEGVPKNTLVALTLESFREKPGKILKFEKLESVMEHKYFLEKKVFIFH